MEAERPAPAAGWEALAIVRRDARWLLALTAVALVARLLYLGRADLWCDEILFITLATPPHTPWQVILSHWQQISAIGHMPLGAAMHNVVLWAFAGLSEDLSHAAFLQRLPAVLWCTLQVPMVYLLGALVSSRREGRTAAAVMALSTFPIFFAREAYYYAPLMLWGTISLVIFVSIVKAGRATRGALGLLALSFAATALCHINGVTLSLAALLVVTGCLLVNRYPSPGARAEARGLYLRLWPASAAGLAAAAPFFVRRILHPSGQVFQEQQPSALQALHDFLGKTLLGTNLPLGVLGWLLIALAVVAAVRRGEGRPVRLVALALFAIPFVIILFSAIHTLYFARYFNAILALYYVLIAMGLGWLADAWGRGGQRPALARYAHAGLVALLLAPHVFLFLPESYRLPAKGVNYGGIARWLNANLPPGTPYVMESAYELRFTSGFFPTPDLLPAAPYVHGAGAVEMQRLRSAQRAFLERFPEAPFIESARSGSEPGAPFGTWEWPHSHFKQRADVRNEPLRRLAAWGIWPQVPLRRLGEIQYHTPILYQAPEDVAQLARERGEPVLLKFSDWQVREVQRGTYARVRMGNWGVVATSNLTERSVRGRFVLQGALIAPEQSFDLVVKWMGQDLGATARWGGQVWTVETGEVVVPRRDGFLEWGVPVEQATGVQALVLLDARFVPSSAQADSDIAVDQ